MNGWRHALVLTALLCCSLICDPASAQVTKPSRVALERQIITAFGRDDVRRAIRLIDRYLVHWPNDHDMLYNSACGYALLGDREKASEQLLEAVRKGFRDFAYMESDEDLASIRDHEVFLAILEARDRIRESSPPVESRREHESEDGWTESPNTPRSQRGSEEFAEWRERTGEEYRFESLNDQRLQVTRRNVAVMTLTCHPSSKDTRYLTVRSACTDFASAVCAVSHRARACATGHHVTSDGSDCADMCPSAKY